MHIVGNLGSRINLALIENGLYKHAFLCEEQEIAAKAPQDIRQL
jgi:hypothetical protein